MQLVLIIATILVTIAVTVILILWNKRRRTPHLKFDPDDFVDTEALLCTIAGLTGGAVHAGNAASILQNGEFFTSILEAIDAATGTVHLETFVWSRGEVERQITDALCAKARAGVKVRLMLDTLGAEKADPSRLAGLRASGVSVAMYCPPTLLNWHRFNHRTHRKLLIVDGRIGYVFGHGIADNWRGEGDDPEHWRDTGVRIEGPIVNALQSVFAEHWVEETSELLVGPDCFPAPVESGDVRAHVVSSASGEAVSSVATLYVVAIASAQREVIIQNPYFAPHRGIVDLLAMMVQRGVTVHLMVPGKQTDSPFVRRAGCFLYADILAAGVRLYEYQRTLIHQKILIIDESWSHVGSTNFDARSLELNEEVSIGMVDSALAKELKAAFHADLAHCQELDLPAWRKRGRVKRCYDWFAYLLHKQL